MGINHSNENLLSDIDLIMRGISGSVWTVNEATTLCESMGPHWRTWIEIELSLYVVEFIEIQ